MKDFRNEKNEKAKSTERTRPLCITCSLSFPLSLSGKGKDPEKGEEEEEDKEEDDGQQDDNVR